MTMTTQINQLIEQIKLDLDNYQSQLSEIEIESTQEKERLLEAIRAEEADIKSLLSKYRYLKQQNEIGVVRSSFNSLSNFKRNLLVKIDLERNPSSSLSSAPDFEQELNGLKADQAANSSSVGDLPKKPEAQPFNGYVGAPTNTAKEKKNQSATIAQIKPEVESTNGHVDTEKQIAQEENNQAKTITQIKPEVESTNGHVDTEKQIAQEENNQAKTIAQMLEFIDSSSHQDLAKLYPANIAKVIPEFNVLDIAVRDHLIKHYQKKDRNVCNALIKLYQKPTLKQDNTVPEAQSLSIKDRKYHDFVSQNYPNALPFFWFLVNKEPDSLRYVVMECAQDHIIFTNETGSNNSNHQLNLSFTDLLEINNGANLETYLRDIFICFHPQRVSRKNDSKNKYFDYIDSLITQGATLENSKALKFWSQMKQFGYDTVAADDFPVKMN